MDKDELIRRINSETDIARLRLALVSVLLVDGNDDLAREYPWDSYGPSDDHCNHSTTYATWLDEDDVHHAINGRISYS